MLLGNQLNIILRSSLHLSEVGWPGLSATVVVRQFNNTNQAVLQGLTEVGSTVNVCITLLYFILTNHIHRGLWVTLKCSVHQKVLQHLTRGQQLKEINYTVTTQEAVDMIHEMILTDWRITQRYIVAEPSSWNGFMQLSKTNSKLPRCQLAESKKNNNPWAWCDADLAQHVKSLVLPLLRQILRDISSNL